MDMIRSHNFGDQDVLNLSQSNLNSVGCDLRQFQLPDQAAGGERIDIGSLSLGKADTRPGKILRRKHFCLGSILVFKGCHSVFVSCDLDDLARSRGPAYSANFCNFNCRVASDLDSYSYIFLSGSQTWQ